MLAGSAICINCTLILTLEIAVCAVTGAHKLRQRHLHQLITFPIRCIHLQDYKRVLIESPRILTLVQLE